MCKLGAGVRDRPLFICICPNFAAIKKTKKMKNNSVLPAFIIIGFGLVFTSCTPNKSQTETTVTKDSTTHNPSPQINWGYYKTITPCADCEGIETVIRLKNDNSFEEWCKYLGKKDTVFYNAGKIETAGNNTIRLVNNTDTSLFEVSANHITQLDKSGNKVTGVLADKYVFKNINSNGITNKYWVLKELNHQPVTATHKSATAYFILNDADTSVKGYGGCNILFGKYELNESASRIRFLNTGATQRACIDANHETEFFRVLNNTDNYNLVGDTLFLNKARMAPLARFEAVYLR